MPQTQLSGGHLPGKQPPTPQQTSRACKRLKSCFGRRSQQVAGSHEDAHGSGGRPCRTAPFHTCDGAAAQAAKPRWPVNAASRRPRFPTGDAGPLSAAA
eukprot:scaffold59617_cov79-Phaeocystis_antarctica.AAC.26